jgi:hypothetical protein
MLTTTMSLCSTHFANTPKGLIGASVCGKINPRTQIGTSLLILGQHICQLNRNYDFVLADFQL